MSTLHIQLLGGFDARFESGERVSLPTRKAEAMLAYLALSPESVRTRGQLAGLLWSDRAEPQARSSLRQALAALRRSLKANGVSFLTSDGENIRLDPDALSVDVSEFEQLAANGSNGNLARADRLYQGDFLDGFIVRDPAFSDWLDLERARLHQLAIDTADRLLAGLLQEGKRDPAIAAARRLLSLDPLRESAYRTLMRLYAKQDQRGLAAREFERCRDVLRTQLCIEPAPATRRLYEEIIRMDGDGSSGNGERPFVTGPLPLPSKPSVAVLPFTNLSGDPDQSYLSDGLTEDVITDLSRFGSLFVIGPQSSLALKDRTAGLAQTARELGVEYLVEGSVRKVGETLRVTVQLIDPSTQYRLWAERFDRPFAEIFEIQDEIVGNIACSLSVNIEQARARRTRRLPKESLEAYDLCLRAKQGILAHTAEGFAEARDLLQAALDFDPEFAPAWVWLAVLYEKDAYFVPGLDPCRSLDMAHGCAEKAMALDRTLAMAYACLSWVHLNRSDFRLARSFLDHATELAPHEPEVLVYRAYILAYLGELDAAMETAAYSWRMNPFYPDLYIDAASMVHFMSESYHDYLELALQVKAPMADNLAWVAAAYAHLGDEETARHHAEAFLDRFGSIWAGNPSAGPRDFVRWVVEVSNPFARDEDRLRLKQGLELAGLPT